jgi:hypothetical protein
MALMSQMIRSVAITGNTDYVNAWFADRQGGRWAEQTVRAAFPQQTAPQLRELDDLRRRGAVTDAEFDRLRARIGH